MLLEQIIQISGGVFIAYLRSDGLLDFSDSLKALLLLGFFLGEYQSPFLLKESILDLNSNIQTHQGAQNKYPLVSMIVPQRAVKVIFSIKCLVLSFKQGLQPLIPTGLGRIGELEVYLSTYPYSASAMVVMCINGPSDARSDF